MSHLIRVKYEVSVQTVIDPQHDCLHRIRPGTTGHTG